MCADIMVVIRALGHRSPGPARSDIKKRTSFGRYGDRATTPAWPLPRLAPHDTLPEETARRA